MLIGDSAHHNTHVPSSDKKNKLARPAGQTNVIGAYNLTLNQEKKTKKIDRNNKSQVHAPADTTSRVASAEKPLAYLQGQCNLQQQQVDSGYLN